MDTFTMERDGLGASTAPPDPRFPSPRIEPSPRTCSSALAAAGAQTGSRRWRLCSGLARGTPPSGICEPPSTQPKHGNSRTPLRGLTGRG